MKLRYSLWRLHHPPYLIIIIHTYIHPTLRLSSNHRYSTWNCLLQAMEMNQAILIEALESLEVKLAASEFLASPAFSLADIVCIATLKPAFEKVRFPSTSLDDVATVAECL